jgi:flagellar protein FlgJ
MADGLQTAAVYTDFQGLDALRRDAHDQSPEALRKVAQQFEALFTQMMLKSMRDASPGDELFGSEETKFYQGMFDQQIALELASKGSMGLADLLVRQLGPHVSGQPGAAPAGGAVKGYQAVSHDIGE